jgi:hypothetical protein
LKIENAAWRRGMARLRGGFGSVDFGRPKSTEIDRTEAG